MDRLTRDPVSVCGTVTASYNKVCVPLRSPTQGVWGLRSACSWTARMEGIIPPSMRRWLESSTWAAAAEHHTWDSLKSRHPLLRALVTGSPRSVPAGCLPGESSAVGGRELWCPFRFHQGNSPSVRSLTLGPRRLYPHEQVCRAAYVHPRSMGTQKHLVCCHNRGRALWAQIQPQTLFWLDFYRQRKSYKRTGCNWLHHWP